MLGFPNAVGSAPFSKVVVAEMFYKKGVSENFANHRCFPVNFAKFSRTAFKNSF